MLMAMSDAVWLQLIALGEHFVAQIIPALTLISVIAGTILSARNRAAIGQTRSEIGEVKQAIQVKAEEIKDAGRAHAETAATTAATAAAEALAARTSSDRASIDLIDRLNNIQSRESALPPKSDFFGPPSRVS